MNRAETKKLIQEIEETIRVLEKVKMNLCSSLGIVEEEREETIAEKFFNSDCITEMRIGPKQDKNPLVDFSKDEHREWIWRKK